MKKPYNPPAIVNTEELCKDLVALAAFAEPKATRDKIYKAVRQLQLLDQMIARPPQTEHTAVS